MFIQDQEAASVSDSNEDKKIEKQAKMVVDGTDFTFREKLVNLKNRLNYDEAVLPLLKKLEVKLSAAKREWYTE
jgi:hypothetical protein